MNQTFYIIPSPYDAQHHGVLGMKWGIRRYQPYSVVPRGSGKGGEEIGEAALYGKDDIKAAKKNVSEAFRAAKKTYSTLNKFDKKVKKAIDNPDESGTAHVKTDMKALKKVADADKIFKEAVDQLSAAKIVLGSDEYDRALRKSVAVDNMRYHALFGLPVSIPNSIKNENVVKKINYEMLSREIREKAASEKTENKKPQSSIQKSYSSNYSKGLNESQRKSMENAVRNDSFSISFLEAIQNSEIAYNKDRHAILNEYNKYLKDPENYWKTERHKLRQA